MARPHALWFVALAAISTFQACGDDGESKARAATNDASTADGAGSPDAAAIDGDAPDGSASDVLAERSGTRIKRELWSTADGFRQRVGLYDAELARSCFVAVASDGMSRCLPQGASAHVFTDSGCTQRVAAWSACSSKPTYATAQPSIASCAPLLTKVFSLGADVAPTELFTGEPGACWLTSTPSPEYKYSKVTEVAAATFAQLDEVTRPLAPGLDGAFLETADGLQVLSGFRDATHGSLPCVFSTAMDDKLHCVPGGSDDVGSLFGNFSDDKCTTEVGSGACPSFTLARRFLQGCPSRVQIFSVGAAIDADAGVYRQNGASCDGPQAIGSTIKPVTAEVSPSDFPAATITASTASARLRIDRLELAPNTLVAEPYPLIRDTAQGATCSPATASDGNARCLPTPAAMVHAFADDQCTVLVARVSSGACGVPKFARRTLSAACDDRTAVHPLLAKRATTLTYVRNVSNECVKQDLGPAVDIYDVGAELPATDFAEVTLARE